MTDRNVVIRLRGEIADFQGKMLAAGKAVGHVADKMTSAEKESVKFRRGLDSLGSVGAKVGLGAAAGLGAAVAAAANFDQAMSLVQAATHETTGNMDALRQAALEAGAQTAFSASEAAGGIENLAKAGVSTADILNGGLAGALDLAAAGGVGVAEAAETAATALTQFNLAGSDVPHVADLLAAAAGKAQGEVGDMSYALKQSGLVAAQMGLSIEETTGTLAAFASAGLLGSDAGTSFKTMLLSLANPSTKAANLMDELNINAYDANGNLVTMSNLAGQLSDAFEGQSQATRDAALATLFGSDAIRAASVLYSQGARGITDWTSKVNDAGYAAETAAIRMDNLKGDVEALMGSLETALIGTGSGAAEMLRGLTQGATDAVNAFNNLSPEMQGVVTKLLALTAITGGGLWFGSKVVQGVSDTRVALQNLGVQAGVTGRALRAGLKVGVILEGLNLLDKAFDDLLNKRLDGSNLGRSLDALSDGRVMGEVLSVFGADLEQFGADAYLATSNTQALQRAVAGLWVVGGPLSGGAGDAVANMQQIDEALAGMVESGQQGQAARVFDQLAKAADKAGVDVEELRDLFEQYTVAVSNAKGGLSAGEAILGGLGTAQSLWAQAVARSTAETKSETAALEDNLDAMRDKRAATLEAQNAQIGYQAAIDDAAKAFKDNGKTLDITTEKGRANRLALLNLAGAWNGLSDKAKNAEGSHKAAVDEFVKAATQMGMNEDAARRYAQRLLEIPPKRQTEIDLKAQKAQEALDRFREAFYGLDKDFVTATVRVRAEHMADRLDQEGRGFATGGYTGNYPINSIAGVVHGREFVVNAAATAQNRELLEAINRGVPGYRDGGYVRQMQAQASNTTNYYGGGTVRLSESDIARLSAAMLRARPMYGDAHFTSEGDYDRARREHQRTVAGGGVRF